MPISTSKALIIGGGLAGAAAAIRLGRRGMPVTLIERQEGATDKVCGEFLSHEAQLHLRDLGLDLVALGGQPITHLRLIRGRRVVRAALPFAGMALSRRVLDAALLDAAAESGVCVQRGQGARLAEAAPSADTAVLLATGKHDLHTMKRPGGGTLVGFKTYYRLSSQQAAALAGHVEVLLFAEGYAGLQHVEGGQSNLCLLVQRARLARVGHSWERLLDDLCAESPHLRERLDGGRALRERPLSIYRVPYGFVHRTSERPEVFRLGDQMAVIDSFSGDGMSIALHSAGRAARAITQGHTAEQYHRQMRQDVGGQIGRARWMYRVGQQWPDMLTRVAQIWPRGLAVAASLTRVPESALQGGLQKVSKEGLLF